MMVFVGIIIALLTLIGIIFSRFITTFIHELGHSLLALLLTDGQVHMYIGSFGFSENSKKIKIGRLQVYFKFNFWDLQIGLTSFVSKLTPGKALSILLAGPLFSLISGIFLLFTLVNTNFSDGIKFTMAVLMVSSFWDFIINIVPRREEATTANKRKVFNDGRQILELISRKKEDPEITSIEDLIDKNEIEKAESLLHEGIIGKKNNRAYYVLLLDLFKSQNRLKEYISTFDKYLDAHNPSITQVYEWADVKMKLHDYDDVVKILTNIIYDGKSDYHLHFKRGKALIELGEYRDALIDFHALTLGDKEDPLALANRAYCQFKLEFFEEAREDILKAIELDKSNQGEIYFLAGKIFHDSDENKALGYYKHALSLGYEHHALDFNISQLERFKAN